MLAQTDLPLALALSSHFHQSHPPDYNLGFPEYAHSHSGGVGEMKEETNVASSAAHGHISVNFDHERDPKTSTSHRQPHPHEPRRSATLTFLLRKAAGCAQTLLFERICPQACILGGKLSL
jgi:hypothetical protein